MRKAAEAVSATRRSGDWSRGEGARAIAIVLIACTIGAGCSSQDKPRQSAAPQQLPPRLAVPEPELIREAHASALEAYEAYEEQDPQEAERLYRLAAETYPEYPAVWNNLGVLYMSLDRYAEAQEVFARAAELAPDDPRPVYNRGLLYLNRRYPRQALPLFLEALERDANHLGALRGSIRAEVLLREVSEQTLDRIARAMMLEQDERWRLFYETERRKIEASLGLDER